MRKTFRQKVLGPGIQGTQVPSFVPYVFNSFLLILLTQRLIRHSLLP